MRWFIGITRWIIDRSFENVLLNIQTNVIRLHHTLFSLSSPWHHQIPSNDQNFSNVWVFRIDINNPRCQSEKKTRQGFEDIWEFNAEEDLVNCHRRIVCIDRLKNTTTTNITFRIHGRISHTQDYHKNQQEKQILSFFSLSHTHSLQSYTYRWDLKTTNKNENVHEYIHNRNRHCILSRMIISPIIIIFTEIWNKS